MRVLSRVFGTAVQARNRLYDRGTLRSYRLRGPVVSVGNISVGGSGKTPFVILLGELLKQEGIRFDVLTRGYRRAAKEISVVDPDGSAEQFGDEPLLVARKLGVPVIVGADRYRAGLLAEERFGPQLHLLDDGFQHRRLARDFDIVLLTPEDQADDLLPAGRLREPHLSLSRADAVVLTRGARAESFPLDGKEVFRVERGIECGEIPSRPLAFCGIAKPEVFFNQLRQRGIVPGAQISFRDHHRYSEGDLQRLCSIARQRSTNGFVTTEKDVINLGAHANVLAPLTVVRATMSIDDPGRLVALLRARIAERQQLVS